MEKKIKKAFCAEREIEGNPILDYCKNIIFGLRDEIAVFRKPENGGDVYLFSYM